MLRIAAPSAIALSFMFSRKRKTAVASYGTSSIQGRRPYQEDMYHACATLPRADCAFFGVFDGHGGDKASSFCAKHMPSFLASSKEFKAKDLVEALKTAFQATEDAFIEKAGRESLRDGTTAVVALVDTSAVTVAHVGDSRAVMCRADGEVVTLTKDHKPELEEEQVRLKELGGYVEEVQGCLRVMGQLGMTRAIGDRPLKPYVSSEPDVTVYPLEKGDQFIVLASDGVFDVFEDETVVRMVRSCASPQEAANLLTHSAFNAGVNDNATALVVALDGYQPGEQQARSMVEPWAAKAPVDFFAWAPALLFVS